MLKYVLITTKFAHFLLLCAIFLASFLAFHQKICTKVSHLCNMSSISQALDDKIKISECQEKVNINDNMKNGNNMFSLPLTLYCLYIKPSSKWWLKLIHCAIFLIGLLIIKCHVRAMFLLYLYYSIDSLIGLFTSYNSKK